MKKKIIATKIDEFFLVYIPRLQESQILQNSSEILINFAFLARILQVCNLTRIANFANLLQCRTFLTRF